jgi:hypothetical protein
VEVGASQPTDGRKGGSVTKLKTCKQCMGLFAPQRPLQAVCSPRCAVGSVKAQKAQEKASIKSRLEALVTKPELVKKAQTAFNAFIRARDRGKPCISCGRPLGLTPNSYDCGHYRSVGSAPHMRFVEDNAHGQCKYCNNHLSGNHVEYRKRLIERIGLRSVELIESDNVTRKYTQEGLIEIAKHYRNAAKELKDGD